MLKPYIEFFILDIVFLISTVSIWFKKLKKNFYSNHTALVVYFFYEILSHFCPRHFQVPVGHFITGLSLVLLRLLPLLSMGHIFLILKIYFNFGHVADILYQKKTIFSSRKTHNLLSVHILEWRSKSFRSVTELSLDFIAA